MWNIFRKSMFKKVLVCMGVPYTRESFHDVYHKAESDFIRSLKTTYDCEKEDELWTHYQSTASEVASTIKQFAKAGAEVISLADIKVLENANQYDVVIITAHHSEVADELDFNGKMIPVENVANAFPSDFSGYVDLSCCYSTLLQTYIKRHCLSPDCHVIAVNSQTSLSLRMILYQFIIKDLCKHDISYLDTYKNVIIELQKVLTHTSDRKCVELVHLGAEGRSTIYAPGKVKRGNSFVVQIYLYKKKDSEEVELNARMIDKQTEMRATKCIPFTLRKGDSIEIELCTPQKNKGFKIDKKRKNCIWLNEPVSVDYIVGVDKNCDEEQFIGKVKIAKNKQNLGEIVFTTEIVDNYETNKSQAIFDYYPYNQEKESAESSLFIKNELEKQLLQLQEDLNTSNSLEEKDSITREIDVCKELMEIVNTNHKELDQKTIRVFISSASDMKEYRDIIKKEVESCNMYPEMYENWTQGNTYPRRECCKHVMQSDIFVCILGARYGFIEKEWERSMTEIEYNVAKKIGIPMLFYVVKHYEKDMQDLLPELEKEVSKQKALIQHLTEKRLVEMFENKLMLQLIAGKELTQLKTSLEIARGIRKPGDIY